jgi:hypothetical protein
MTTSNPPRTLALAALVGLSLAALHPESAAAQSTSLCPPPPPQLQPLPPEQCNPQIVEQCLGWANSVCTAVPPPPPPQLHGSLPLRISASGRYFDSYTTSTTNPLLGLSDDYTCHICQPGNDTTLCTLNKFHDVFAVAAPLNNNLNSVLRLTTIFNSSPGASSNCSCLQQNQQTKQIVWIREPFKNEEVYYYNGNRWNLNRYNRTFLADLDEVVYAANQNNIVVEVTLFDPWDKNWCDSPFNQKNTVNTGTKLGFTQQAYFVSEKNDTVNGTPTQDGRTRAAQKAGACRIVQELSKYPNVIFEIANEPDLPQLPPAAIQESDILAWEQHIIEYLRDPNNNCSLGKHLIQMNGHHLDTQNGTDLATFGWSPGGSVADLASAHYAFFTGITADLQSN